MQIVIQLMSTMIQYDPKNVSIIIAAKNEAVGMARIIDSVRSYARDIIVVDGHSRDNTKAIVEAKQARYFLDNKKGRGDALKVGMKVAKGKVIVFFDADGSHDANDISKLVLPILRDQSDMVICSRRTGGSFDAGISLSGMLRSLGSDLLVYLVNKRFNTGFTDIIYSFRSIRRTSALNLVIEADGFEVEQEMVIAAIKNKLRIQEIPSREKARGWGESKLKTIAGYKLLLHLIKHTYFR